MSDNEDILGEDLGDHSLADYNLGNEEEEQLLADDYETGGSQNVPVSVDYGEPNMVPPEYRPHNIDYGVQPMPYVPVQQEAECVVPNITVEVPNVPPAHSTYAPYEPRHYEGEHAVPPPIPAGPIEPPQIVPSEITGTIPNGEGRERFISERPVGAQRLPQVRDIPDTLDKVVIPRGGFAPRGRTSWRNPQFNARFSHPYRRNNVHRGNFTPRNSFPPPQIIRQNVPQIRPEIPEIRPEIAPKIIRQDLPPEIRPQMIRPEIRPEILRPEIRPEILRPELIRVEVPMGPEIHHERPHFQNFRYERPMFAPRFPFPRPFGPREMLPGRIEPEMRMFPGRIEPEMLPDRMEPEGRMLSGRMEQEGRMLPGRMEPEGRMLPGRMAPEGRMLPNRMEPEGRMLPERMDQDGRMLPGRMESEGRMLPGRMETEGRMLSGRMESEGRMLPGRMEPEGRMLSGRMESEGRMLPGRMEPEGRMLPGRFEPEVRMLPVVPANLPVPPAALAGKKVLINPHFKGNFQPPVEGPVKDIDDAAERFIAEQRDALARAASRKFAPRRSPQRYIENTTIEIENDLARRPPPADDDLLRRQEEFINANRAGLRRRMRSPSPPRRSPSPPRRSPERRHRDNKHRDDEESEYRRRVREQETLREHVLKAKELRRRRNAMQGRDRERENREKEQQQQQRDKEIPKETQKEEFKDKENPKTKDKDLKDEQTKPDTTRTSPEKDLTPERPPAEKPEEVKPNVEEVNSTCDGLTPPRVGISDDELELILGDIDGILSDDDDTGRFKDTPKKEPPPKKPVSDLRSKLPAKTQSEKKPQRQKIVFTKHTDKKEKSPPVKRPIVSSSTKTDDTEQTDVKKQKTNPKTEDKSSIRARPRIIFDNKEKEQQQEKEKPDTKFSNRRVILQRKTDNKSVFSRIEITNDPTKPNPGIFSRAVRTITGEKHTETKNTDFSKNSEPQIEYGDSDDDSNIAGNTESGNIAQVGNLPHGMTDTRLKTLAGNDVQGYW